MIDNREICDLTKFHILQYDKMFKAIKICSITNEPYIVELTRKEFKKYYKFSGKYTKTLKKHTKEEREFLKTTLTPEEIKSINWRIKKQLHPKLWRFYLKKDTFNHINDKYEESATL